MSQASEDLDQRRGGLPEENIWENKLYTGLYILYTAYIHTSVCASEVAQALLHGTSCRLDGGCPPSSSDQIVTPTDGEEHIPKGNIISL